MKASLAALLLGIAESAWARGASPASAKANVGLILGFLVGALIWTLGSVFAPGWKPIVQAAALFTGVIVFAAIAT